MTPRERARELVAKLEHGTDEHKQWLRDVAVPLIAHALADAREQALEDAAKLTEETRLVKRVLNGRKDDFGQPSYDIVEANTGKRLAAAIRALKRKERG